MTTNKTILAVTFSTRTKANGCRYIVREQLFKAMDNSVVTVSDSYCFHGTSLGACTECTPDSEFEEPFAED